VLDNPDDTGSPSDAAEAARLTRLAAGLRAGRTGRPRWFDQRMLAILAGVLVPLGVILVLIGWHGASRTPNLHEQIPYLISGAELGQTLAIVGALCYFAHWITALLRESRDQSAAIVAAIAHLEQAIVGASRDVDGEVVAADVVGIEADDASA
jgi:multisubunit Na+/H+ antiporter MnhG subunit